MNCFALWQFVRNNPTLAGPIISGLLALVIALLVQELQKRRDRHRELQELAVCWRAVLLELGMALDRMQETTRHLIRNRQRPSPLEKFHKSDILLHQGLREGFLLRASDQEGAGLVMSLHQDLHLFIWNVNQATNARLRTLGTTSASQVNRSELKRTIEAFDDAAIWFACNRQHRMVREWKESVKLLNDFCSGYELERGNDLVVPTVIPPKWQMKESEPWDVEDLAPVGKDNWEE